MGRSMAAEDPQAVDAAVNVLTGGGIIVFPTDTVYGIGCDAASGQAISRLYALKRRPMQKPLVMLLGDRDAILSFVKRPRKSVKKIYEHFFPGALTVIMRAKKSAPRGLVGRDGSISVRVPDASFIRRVLKRFNHPVASSSANIAGRKAPRVHKGIKLRVDLLVRDDEEATGIPSAVLDTTVFPFVLRRRGSVSLYAIERLISSKVHIDRTVGFNVLFICTGNSCRSPMAEGMLRGMVRKWGLSGVKVSSCGVFAYAGSPASVHACEVMKMRGYDITEHRSRSIADCRLMDEDLILCMERAHQREIKGRWEGVAEKTFMLTEYCGKKGDIPDPIGGSRSRYEHVACQIEQCVRKVGRELAMRYGALTRKEKTPS